MNKHTLLCRQRRHAPVVTLSLLGAVVVLSARGHEERMRGHFLFRVPPKHVSSSAGRMSWSATSRPFARSSARASRRARASSRSSSAISRRPFVPYLTLADNGPEPLRPAASDFPPFVRTVHPVAAVPDWGRMRSAAEWERSYAQMDDEDFVPVPAYDLDTLTIPVRTLASDSSSSAIAALTAKLYYSTRFFGKYDLDAGEYTGRHPGVDLKLAFGTPVGAIAGGRVHATGENERLGKYVMLEHRHPTDGAFVSVYGHLHAVYVAEGEAVFPGDVIGEVGMTGSTSAPHLHLQIDIADDDGTHEQFVPDHEPARGERGLGTVHPIDFIRRYAGGI